MQTSEVIVSQDKLSEVFCRHNHIARYVRKESYAQGVADTLELMTKRDRRSPYTSRALRANAALAGAALDQAAISAR
jgi:hypothetical protein